MPECNPLGNLPVGTSIADVSPSGRVPCLRDGELRVWDSLAVVEYLAGPHFSAVDAFYAPVAFRVQTYGLQMEPAAMQYVSRLLALASMRDWYAAALQEPWREEEHEAAVRDILLEDRRNT